MHLLLFSTCLSITYCSTILHQYTNQMAYIHLIYTIFFSQTVLIQSYKRIHVNSLRPQTYSSLFSSFLPWLGHLVVLHPSVQTLHPRNRFITPQCLLSFPSEPRWVVRRVQALASSLFQSISLSWCDC